MNTQYEKNSVYVAKLNYGMVRRKRELKRQLGLFLICLGGVCAALYLIISAFPH